MAIERQTEMVTGSETEMVTGSETDRDGDRDRQRW